MEWWAHVEENIPKELILVNFQGAALLPLSEAAACLTRMEKSKHCVGSKCPAKLASDTSCCPASASWARSKHASHSSCQRAFWAPTPALLPMWSLFLGPSLLLLLSVLLSISRIILLSWPTLGCCPLCSDVGNYIPSSVSTFFDHWKPCPHSVTSWQLVT